METGVQRGRGDAEECQSPIRSQDAPPMPRAPSLAACGPKQPPRPPLPRCHTGPTSFSRVPWSHTGPQVKSLQSPSARTILQPNTGPSKERQKDARVPFPLPRPLILPLCQRLVPGSVCLTAAPRWWWQAWSHCPNVLPMSQTGNQGTERPQGVHGVVPAGS